ncbi:MAG: mechanosensitive ion channel, partial [Thermoanaerobaculia bacterium]|nr:mechanosensitive ion channel [Thermoanaerobaculia bacterium]
RFSDAPVENVSREPSRKILLNLGLTNDTPPEQIERAMEILREIAEEHGSVEENIMTSFNSFGDFSLGILFIYFIRSGEDILQTQTDVNLAILRRFNEEGLDFAFPTQTILASSVDSKQDRAAELQGGGKPRLHSHPGPTVGK